MAFDQISTSVTILNSGLIGYQGISLTDFTLTTESYIAAGSGIEIAGAFFKASIDIIPNATSWAAIATGTTAYLTLEPSGTVGSQVLTAYWSSVASVWSTSKQGWYTSAGSSVRHVAKVYKGSNVQYLYKYLYRNCQNSDTIDISEIYDNSDFGDLHSFTSSTNGATYVIPEKGFILGFAETSISGGDVTTHRAEVLINGSWETIGNNDPALFCYSNGSNIRFRVVVIGTPISTTSYYQILNR